MAYQNNPRDSRGPSSSKADFVEKVVHVLRTAKVVKGGRRFNFTVFVVVGNQKGLIGYGAGKSKEAQDATRKATERAHKHYYNVQLKGGTIQHPIVGTQDGGVVMLRPASPGTGLIAGGAVRAVLECAGVKDVLSKSMGSSNKTAVAKATIDALLNIRSAEQVKAIKSAGAAA
jgi:small subunit ribosomal protein S5